MTKKRNHENDEAYKNFRLEDYLPSIDRPKPEEKPVETKQDFSEGVTTLFPVSDRPNTSTMIETVSDALQQDETEIREDGTDDVSEEAKVTIIETDSSEGRAIARRISSKQRKLSLEEYRSTYLQVPKIADRKPVFVSREVRDRLDEIVRRLGGRGMSVSGLVENIARQHFDAYANDIDQWRKL